MRPHRPKEKKPLSVEHQLLLLGSARKKQDWVSAALIMMLQGGCMPTEPARLRSNQDICLDAKVPNVVISGGALVGGTRRGRSGTSCSFSPMTFTDPPQWLQTSTRWI